jgi:hypothetical protein
MKLVPLALATGTAVALAAGSAAPDVITAPVAAVRPVAAPASAAGLLQAIRTGRHDGYDRLVLQFGGPTAPAHRIRYVDQVRADPSDRPVPLGGHAFLSVVLDGATLDTSPREADPGRAQRYTGPVRVSPGLPQLKEVAVAGDFEGVLSFGVGLARPAGLRVSTLTAPARLVIDVRYAPARRLLWPATTLRRARDLQRAVDSGHQPWLCAATSVVTSYAGARLGWADGVVESLSPTVYQVTSAAANATAVVTAFQPVRRGGGCGVWVVSSVAR